MYIKVLGKSDTGMGLNIYPEKPMFLKSFLYGIVIILQGIKVDGRC